MNSGFFRKTAWSNIKKNYRFFIPRILSEAGLLACFYISLTLAMDKRIAQIKGGDFVTAFMWIGIAVLSTLSVILMFYINSFLMKQRKREFGLYNVLGMEKKHIGKILLHEMLISSLISVVGGTGLGVLLYKFCSLLICKLLQADIIFGFYFITPLTIIPAAGFFVLIDFITYLFDRINIRKMKPVDLLSSRSAGEKEPKVKWVMFVIGLIALCGGYFLALNVKDATEAITLFFPAVFLVIIGTYFLFVSGTIFILKALKKNQKYYYNKRHMPAVSGLLYRMKQNAVGLASIAILATGVLVMISTTVSLYSGMQKTLSINYPYDNYISAYYYDADNNIVYVPHEKMLEAAENASEKVGLPIKETAWQEYLNTSYMLNDGVLLSKPEAEAQNVNTSAINNLHDFTFITEDEYVSSGGEKLNLSGHEIAVCIMTSNSQQGDKLPSKVTIHGVEYSIVKTVESFPVTIANTVEITTNYGVVVSGDEEISELYENLREAVGNEYISVSERLAVLFESRETAFEKGYEFTDALLNGKFEDVAEELTWVYDSVWDAREAVIGMYGSLLFLGIILGAVSMFATVLIIYYKQISEGYEDRERFVIMEKIGMSKAEVKKTINSQVLLVFFLPLVTAGIHLCFAYPMLKKLLKLLMLPSDFLFFICALITYAVFALVYVLIYSGTSKTYYKIVN